MSLSFKPELMRKVLTGEKTVTRRAWPTNYREGQVVSIVPGMGRIACGKVKIVAVDEALLTATFSDAEANREGFANHAEFIAYWCAVNNKRVIPDISVARIEFELIETTRTICESCDGIGTKDAAQPREGDSSPDNKPCPTCDGKREVVDYTNWVPQEGGAWARKPCPDCTPADPPAPVDGGPFEIEYDERMGMSDWNWSVTLFGRRVGQMYDTEDQAIAERDELNAKLAASQSSHQLGERRVREAAEALLEAIENFGSTYQINDEMDELAAALHKNGEANG